MFRLDLPPKKNPLFFIEIITGPVSKVLAFSWKIFFRIWSKRLVDFESASFAPREKCLNTEFFLVRIFPHSDWIRRDTPYLSISSPNGGKYGPEKLRIWTLFTQCLLVQKWKIWLSAPTLTAVGVTWRMAGVE